MGKHPGYGAQEVERGLIAVAFNNGNASRAARELKAAGLPIDRTTLRTWMIGPHQERYARVCAEVLPQVREAAAREHMDLAAQNMEVERRMVQRLNGQVDEIPARDMAGAVRNVATSAGIHSQKAQEYTDEPMTRAAKNFGAMLREFKQIVGVELLAVVQPSGELELVEGTAVEEASEDKG